MFHCLKHNLSHDETQPLGRINLSSCNFIFVDRSAIDKYIYNHRFGLQGFHTSIYLELD